MEILIIDDHELFRDGLGILLRQLEPGTSVTEVESGALALEKIEAGMEFDIVLLDYHLPDQNGLSVLCDLKMEAPELPVILLSAEEDPNLVRRALQEGASGFITKTSTTKVMLSAVKLVLSGGVYVPPLMLGTHTQPEKNTERNTATVSKSVAGKLKITDRQQDVLTEMGKGLSNKEIAKVLTMSPSTVKVHVAAILKELDVKNRTQAVSKALELGWITG